jgi:hypothetical protein
MAPSGSSPRLQRLPVGAMVLPVCLAAWTWLSGCAAHAPPGDVAMAWAPAPSICYDCFWQYQPAGLHARLAEWYAAHPSHDPLLDADRRYLLARVRNDRPMLLASREAFLALRGKERDPGRRLMVDEALAFTAEECGESARTWFARAARSALRAGEPFKASVYRRLADGSFTPTVGDVAIRRRLEVPPGTTGYVLGASAIHVAPGETIGCQVERTVRDWLSYQFAWDFTARSPSPEELVPWHEGSRLRDILEATPAEILPLSGVLAVRHGDRWLAADDQGVFRFQVLIDKIEYPTTRVYRNVALIVDTHGLSALVEPAARRGARLVVACGDTPYKAEAAWWLAQLGIDAYFPCDRMVGDLLGYQGRGTLIGSAPVRAESGAAVIGDRPVRFSVAETVVAEDTHADGGFQYYDAPARYFRRLAEALPIHVEYAEVTGPDQSQRVVDHAQLVAAQVIAVRVRTDEDARPVRAWLAASRSNRAVLFHSAPYPAGNALFREFPGQTTFGDPRPLFLTGQAAYEAAPGR